MAYPVSQGMSVEIYASDNLTQVFTIFFGALLGVFSSPDRQVLRDGGNK